jgi:hypothetical protein
MKIHAYLPGSWGSVISSVERCGKRLSDRLKKKIERLDRRVQILNSRKWSTW